jgi:hypothetical protein
MNIRSAVLELLHWDRQTGKAKLVGVFLQLLTANATKEEEKKNEEVEG